jgi:predicted aldo/keto reductase-like oxidoreductase
MFGARLICCCFYMLYWDFGGYQVRKVKLGWRGPEVSEMCFGSLAISPLQGKVSEQEGVNLLKYAFERGITWVDTAEIYNNYSQIALALLQFPDVKVVSKSYAATAREMKLSIENARKKLNRDVVDIFLLHEQESAHTLRGHEGAWQELWKAKSKGLVNWIGISTHAIAGVRAGALQPGLDIIHPLLNYQGLGIIDGNLQEMLKAVEFAAELGIGIYAMKVLGGGHLAMETEKALAFVRSIEGVQALALGMSSQDEIDYNLSVFADTEISQDLRNRLKQQKRQLYIADWCQGCGSCLSFCPQGALRLEQKVKVDQKACILCGYCGRACPHFCLKII